jgi:hypothetical protein
MKPKPEMPKLKNRNETSINSCTYHR